MGTSGCLRYRTLETAAMPKRRAISGPMTDSRRAGRCSSILRQCGGGDLLACVGQVGERLGHRLFTLLGVLVVRQVAARQLQQPLRFSMAASARSRLRSCRRRLAAAVVVARSNAAVPPTATRAASLRGRESDMQTSSVGVTAGTDCRRCDGSCVSSTRGNAARAPQGPSSRPRRFASTRRAGGSLPGGPAWRRLACTGVRSLGQR